MQQLTATESMPRNGWSTLKSSETKDKTHHAEQKVKQKIMDRITFPAAAFEMDAYGQRLCLLRVIKGSWNS